jgi:hypothetical protein
MNAIVIAIISIIAGAGISFLIAKWQMRRKKIVHFFVNSYEIGKGLSIEFPEFQLTYKGEGLSDNVCVIKGGLMNIGKKDIDGLKGESDIIMNLPQGCNVRALKVRPSNGQLYIKTNFNENSIDFGINELFVSDEYFEYTAIVENIDNPPNVKFSHRIKDTKKEIENIVVGPDFIKKDSGILKSISTYLLLFGIPTVLYFWKWLEEGGLLYIFLLAFFSFFLVSSLYFVIINEDNRHVLKVLKRAQNEFKKK